MQTHVVVQTRRDFAFIHYAEKSMGDSFTYFSWKPQSKHVVHFPTIPEQNRKDWARNMDEYFMGLALEQARRAASNQEVPIGAILVRPEYHAMSSGLPTSFEILSASHNQVERGMDAIAHAEILCLRAAAKKLSNWRLVNTTLYTTLEPCVTCMAAAYAFRVNRIVYGAQDLRLGAVTSWIQWDKVIPEKHPYHPNGRIAVLGGIREEECGSLLRQFFRKRRIERKDGVGRDMNEPSIGVNRSTIQRVSWLTRLKTKIQSLMRRIL